MNMKMVFRLALIIVLSGLLVTAIVQNLVLTPVQFLAWKVYLPVIALFFISAFVGFLMGVLAYPLLLQKKKPAAKPVDTDKNRAVPKQEK